jgi:hypothetical protein
MQCKFGIAKNAKTRAWQGFQLSAEKKQQEFELFH